VILTQPSASWIVSYYLLYIIWRDEIGLGGQLLEVLHHKKSPQSGDPGHFILKSGEPTDSPLISLVECFSESPLRAGV